MGGKRQAGGGKRRKEPDVGGYGDGERRVGGVKKAPTCLLGQNKLVFTFTTRRLTPVFTLATRRSSSHHCPTGARLLLAASAG